MEYRIDMAGAQAVVACIGRLTFSDIGDFQELGEAIKQEAARKWVLDFSKLEFIDSAGLGMLLMARDMVSSLSIQGAQGQVRKALDLAKFNELIPIGA